MRLLLTLLLSTSAYSAFAQDLEIRGEVKNEFLYKNGETVSNTEIGVNLSHEEGDIGLSLDPENRKITKISGTIGDEDNNLSLTYGETDNIKISDRDGKGLSLTLNFNHINEGYFRVDQSSKKNKCTGLDEEDLKLCVEGNFFLGGGVYQPIGNGLDLALRSKYKIPNKDDGIINETGYSLGTGLRLRSDEIGVEYFMDTEGSDTQSGVRVNYKNQIKGFTFGMSYYEDSVISDLTNENSLDSTWGINASNRINDSTKIETGIKRKSVEGADDATLLNYEMRFGVSFNF